MARSWRIEFEGALYHVLSRGNDQQHIFLDDKDRGSFLTCLGRMSERFEIDIFAYVLMGNHYHLLFRTNLANLSKAMQWLGVTYTRRFNNRHTRSGHLFQGRFKNIIVQNEAYLVQLSCYIHRNPLRAGMVQRLADYAWSSYPAYAYGKTHPSWLNLTVILSRFGTKEPHRLYREKVQQYSEEESRIWEDFYHGLYLGKREFVKRLQSTFLKTEPHSEIPQQGSVLRTHNPKAFLEKAAEVLGCNLYEYRRSLRISDQQRETRDLLIYLMWERGLYKNREIGNLLGVGYSSVSRRAAIISTRLAKEVQFKQHVEKLKSLIKM